MNKTIFTLLLSISVSITAQTKDSKPFVLGYTDQIESKILSEKRNINVYLPEGYKANDTLHYPVIYLLDGGADEDFIHTVDLVQYNNFSWINRVPPSIVVGIANTDRKHDFTFPSQVEAEKKRYPSSGGSKKFIEFMEQELKPFVAKNYKANGQSTLIGQSLGGLLATQILFEKPQLFNQYIIISPSLWWSDGALLQQNTSIVQQDSPHKIQVYIGVGKEGVWASTPTTPHVMEVDANLLADKLRAAQNKNLKVYFDYMPEEDHATSSHPGVFNAFRLLYPKK